MWRGGEQGRRGLMRESRTEQQGMLRGRRSYRTPWWRKKEWNDDKERCLDIAVNDTNVKVPLNVAQTLWSLEDFIVEWLVGRVVGGSGFNFLWGSWKEGLVLGHTVTHSPHKGLIYTQRVIRDKKFCSVVVINVEFNWHTSYFIIKSQLQITEDKELKLLLIFELDHWIVLMVNIWVQTRG